MDQNEYHKYLIIICRQLYWYKFLICLFSNPHKNWLCPTLPIPSPIKGQRPNHCNDHATPHRYWVYLTWDTSCWLSLKGFSFAFPTWYITGVNYGILEALRRRDDKFCLWYMFNKILLILVLWIFRFLLVFCPLFTWKTVA